MTSPVVLERLSLQAVKRRLNLDLPQSGAVFKTPSKTPTHRGRIFSGDPSSPSPSKGGKKCTLRAPFEGTGTLLDFLSWLFPVHKRLFGYLMYYAAESWNSDGQVTARLTMSCVFPAVLGPYCSPSSKSRYDTSLGLLTKKFFKILSSAEDGVVDLNHATIILEVQVRTYW